MSLNQDCLAYCLEKYLSRPLPQYAVLTDPAPGDHRVAAAGWSGLAAVCKDRVSQADGPELYTVFSVLGCQELKVFSVQES